MTKPVQIGAATLYLGDCRDILPTLGKVDAVIMDPPYMINTTSAGSGKLNPWADLCNAAFWFSEIYRLCRRKLHGHGCLWTCLNWRTLPTVQKAAFDAEWQIESLLVWDKCWIGPGGSKGLRPSYELVALMAEGDWSLKNRGLPDIQKFPVSSFKEHGHPAEKPVGLMRWLVDVSEGEIVLDPFMGSGTTGAAAIAAQKAFVGIETEPRWFDLACKRIEEAQRQSDLFIKQPAAGGSVGPASIGTAPAVEPK